MSSSNKTLSLLTATALAGLGITANASALSMSDLAQGYLVAGQAAKASTDAKGAEAKTSAEAKHAEGKCGADGKSAEGKCGADKGKAAGAAAGARLRPATRRPKASVAKASAVASTEVRASIANLRSPPCGAVGLGCAGRCCRSCAMHRLAISISSNARRRTDPCRRPAGDALAELAQRHPLSCHGLSLSLGGTAPLDTQLLEQVGQFLENTACRCTANT